MAKITRDARVLLKRTSTSGEHPIPGIGDDHTTWVGVPSGSSMIYSGEMFVNMQDARMWTRLTGVTISEHALFDLGYVPNETQIMYLRNGHMTGSADMTFNSGDSSVNMTNVVVTNLSGTNTTITNLTVDGPMQMMNIGYGSAPYALFYNDVTSGVSYFTLNLDAGAISYHNPTYPTVESALDKLLYVYPTASIGITSGTQFEIGSSISSVSMNWSVNKTMTSTIVTASSYSSGQLAPTMSGSLTDTNARSTNTTWTINVSDGTNVSSAASSISFMNKAYWGVSSSASLNDAGIIGLANKILTTTRARVIVVTPSTQYWYYCVPVSFGTPTFVIGGVENVPITTPNYTFINASGYSSLYNIYRSEFQLTGSITITIS